jgi:hypothetical protein
VTLIVALIVTFKVFSLHNTRHNKRKELLPIKVQFKKDKNPTWTRIIYFVSIVKKSMLAYFRRMLCVLEVL